MGPEPISILARRRVEAEFVRELLRHLTHEVGEERALAVIRATTAELARRFGAEVAAASGAARPGLAEFRRVVLPMWEEGGALEVEYLEQGPDRLAFNVTRCRYAEMYRELGVPHLGEAMSCGRDGEMCRGFNPDIHFTRTQTIMRGATHCDFRYAAPAEPSAPRHG